MSLLTNWGYTLPELNTLPAMLTAQEYATYTGRNSDGNDRVTAEIAAACAGIRNYVGWHLAPSAACRFETILIDRRIMFVSGDLMMIQLPARFVTDVSSVTIDGVEHTDIFPDQNGLLRVFGVMNHKESAPVVVNYTAGLPESLITPIKELIASRVLHAIAVPPGITSEASGGISVTYNAGWINNTKAVSLPGDSREVLNPYKVQGVF